MAELGRESVEEHQLITDLIAQYEWANVVLVGGDFLKFKHPYLQFENSVQAAEWFRSQDIQNSHILIKGSRSMQMEKLVNYL